MGPVEFLRRKIDVLARHCEDAGRNIAEIEFTGGCKPSFDRRWRRRAVSGKPRWRQIARRCPRSRTTTPSGSGPRSSWLSRWRRGRPSASTWIAECAFPYDDETFERWINEVRPMVDGSWKSRSPPIAFLSNARGGRIGHWIRPVLGSSLLVSARDSSRPALAPGEVSANACPARDSAVEFRD
ncbi:MAG: hypothetical protein M5T61_21200 [Acidimicrobiia bacterium]|nr:hypothetical protein [Acidimicrobiia bacterium]